jgi:hypothetical protein
MKKINYFRSINIWLISLFGFDLLMFLYLILSARVDGNPILPNVVTPIAFVVLVLSVIVSVASIVYSILKKQYKYIISGIGIIIESFILYVAILVIALATIW